MIEELTGEKVDLDKTVDLEIEEAQKKEEDINKPLIDEFILAKTDLTTAQNLDNQFIIDNDNK